jgi:hypothetical protein
MLQSVAKTRKLDTSPFHSPSSILVRFTYDGDANLDGMVEGSDLYILGANWHQTGKTWVQGDFNGNGYVDAADLTILELNWQAGV